MNPTAPLSPEYEAAIRKVAASGTSDPDVAVYRAQLAAVLAELDRVRAELAARQEDISFLERNTLPELRRTAQSHEDGKKRWRTRAEKAEAENARLLAERQQTNAALAERDVALKAAEKRIAELEGAREADHRTWRHDLASLRATREERDALNKRLHNAAMTKTWRNEDGKKFVFVEDIAPALLGIERKAGDQ